MQTEAIQTASLKDRKFWSLMQISLASYFAGPMAGCYFLGRNFRQSGAVSQARMSYLAGVLGTLLLFTIPFIIPENVLAHSRPLFVSIMSSSVIVSVAQMYQKPMLKEYKDSGAKNFSYWWCLLIMLAWVVIQIPLFLFYSFVFSFLL